MRSSRSRLRRSERSPRAPHRAIRSSPARTCRLRRTQARRRVVRRGRASPGAGLPSASTRRFGGVDRWRPKRSGSPRTQNAAASSGVRTRMKSSDRAASYVVATSASTTIDSTITTSNAGSSRSMMAASIGPSLVATCVSSPTEPVGELTQEVQEWCRSGDQAVTSTRSDVPTGATTRSFFVLNACTKPAIAASNSTNAAAKLTHAACWARSPKMLNP